MTTPNVNRSHGRLSLQKKTSFLVHVAFTTCISQLVSIVQLKIDFAHRSRPILMKDVT